MPTSSASVRSDESTPELEDMKRRTCFVAMPAGNRQEYVRGPNEARFIYESIIRPAAEIALRGNVLLGVDMSNSGSINRSIVESLASADIAIFDITGLNPNVFMELGIRYSLRRKTTILIRQSGTAVPFDIQSYRLVEYDPNLDGIEKARIDIRKAIEDSLANANASDSLVFDALPGLDVSLAGVGPIESSAILSSSSGTMTWDDYHRRVNRIATFLVPITRSKKPFHVIIAIERGALVFADILGLCASLKDTLRNVPVIGISPDRASGRLDRDVYDTPNNTAVVNAAIESARTAKGTPNILLLDDVIVSGATANAAASWILGHHHDVDLSFIPLVSRRNDWIDAVRKLLLWPRTFSEKEFGREAIIGLHKTNCDHFPYNKPINDHPPAPTSEQVRDS